MTDPRRATAPGVGTEGGAEITGQAIGTQDTTFDEIVAQLTETQQRELHAAPQRVLEECRAAGHPVVAYCGYTGVPGPLDRSKPLCPTCREAIARVLPGWST